MLLSMKWNRKRTLKCIFSGSFSKNYIQRLLTLIYRFAPDLHNVPVRHSARFDLWPLTEMQPSRLCSSSSTDHHLVWRSGGEEEEIWPVCTCANISTTTGNPEFGTDCDPDHWWRVASSVNAHHKVRVCDMYKHYICDRKYRYRYNIR